MIGREYRLFNMTLFREYIRVKLKAMLDDIPGKKMLMLDPAVMTALTFVDKKLLHYCGVVKEDGLAMYDVQQISPNFNQVVMVAPPNQKTMETFVSLYELNQKKDIAYYLVFCPKKSHACNEYLEARGLLNMVKIRDFSYGLLPIDHDFYSLEMKSFKYLYLLNDQSIYSIVAESILRLQSVYGSIKNIFGKGQAAKMVHDILNVKQKEYKMEATDGAIETLIILDRSIDLVTPLLKSFTYEAMIYEIYGITGGFAKVTNPQPKKQDSIEMIPLNTEKDTVYGEIRMLNAMASMKILRNRIVNLDSMKKEAYSIKDSKRLEEKKAITEKFVTEKGAVNTHTNLCASCIDEMKTISFYKEVSMMQRCLMGYGSKEILEYFSDMIPFGVPLEKLLRPICLYSIIYKGIPKKIYKSLLTDIVQCYGPEAILTLTHLAKLGLLNEYGKSTSNFQYLRKYYRLISQYAINHDNPNDICFSYGGYSPLTVKLVEQVYRNSWRSIPKVMKMVPGDIIMPYVLRQSNIARPVVLVYFVGGVTCGEVAALRLLGKLLGKEMVVATTEILNGSSMIRSILERSI